MVLGSATPSLESHTNALKGKYRRLVLSDAHRAAGPAPGRGGGPARGAAGGRRSDPEPVAARGARRAARAPRAVAPAAEPPRLRHEPAVPRVRAAGRLPELLRSASPCTTAAARPSATTAATRRRPPPPARRASGAYLRLTGYGTERVVEAVRGGAARGAGRPPRPRPRAPGAGWWRRRWPRSRRGRPTSWSAPR